MILTQVGLKLVQVNKSDSIDAEDFSTHSLRMLMCWICLTTINFYETAVMAAY